MFRMIQNACERNGSTFRPETFQIDFECGMIRALKQYFGPTVQVKGCLFHFGQSLWRKIGNLNLTRTFESDDSFRRLFKRLCGLPFCPMNELDNAWIEIYSDAPNNQDYFLKTYFHEETAIFHRMMWNHFETIGPRTTNHLEGWHYALNKAIGHNSPTLYRTIQELQNQQQKFEIDSMLQRDGKVVRMQRKEYRELERRLILIKAKLTATEITLIEYIDAVKYQLPKFTK
ncbi:uncharacterized protein B4U80_04779, partial [Leptotrombidium deliense]